MHRALGPVLRKRFWKVIVLASRSQTRSTSDIELQRSAHDAKTIRRAENRTYRFYLRLGLLSLPCGFGLFLLWLGQIFVFVGYLLPNLFTCSLIERYSPR